MSLSGISANNRCKLGKNTCKLGIVGKAIIDYAEKNNIDVIVIGTKGMSEVEEYFFGSVANKVIHEAHCPVFAIR
jgi:nucleotide-binding universal stress UspA family protein